MQMLLLKLSPNPHVPCAGYVSPERLKGAQWIVAPSAAWLFKRVKTTLERHAQQERLRLCFTGRGVCRKAVLSTPRGRVVQTREYTILEQFTVKE